MPFSGKEVKNAGLEDAVNQYFAVLTDLRSVGVMAMPERMATPCAQSDHDR